MSHELRINRRKMMDETDALLEGVTHHPRFSHATMMWVGIGSAAVSVGSSIYAGTQQKKAADKAIKAQRGLLDSLKYEPIDIEALKREATASAIENATQSLALERELQPLVAAQRDQVQQTKLELARQVDRDLRLEGNLSPDVINRVTTAGRVAGGRSGIGEGSTTPLTASLLGIESINLMNQRRNAAAGLVGPGDPANVGLDPGALASLEVADNAANNQFNIAKAGGESNLINSEAQARAAQIGGQVGMVSSLANLLGKGIGTYQTYNMDKPVSLYDDVIQKGAKRSADQNPLTNPLMRSSVLGLA